MTDPDPNPDLDMKLLTQPYSEPKKIITGSTTQVWRDPSPASEPNYFIFSLPVVAQLLGSKQPTDILEAIEFFVSGTKYTISVYFTLHF
jgi:hypothetical protein